MEIYKEHRVDNEEQLKEFFQKPKALQRLLVNKPGCPSACYTDIIVDDKYIIIERGNITPCRGLRAIFTHRTVTIKWGWSADSKKFRGNLNHGQRSFIKDILVNSNKYEFVEHVPSMCLSNTVLRDILYGKITNPKAAIDAYGKSLKVKHLNKHVFSLADKLGLSPILIMTVIDPAQLETCHEILKNRFENGDYSFRQTFRDMIEQAYALEKVINLMWSPKRMSEEHTKWSRELMKLTIGTKSEEPVWSESIVETFRQHGLELCNTEQRVFEEGYLMHHCVYTNYWNRIQRKDYIALSMELEDGPVTIGLARKSYRQEGIGFYLDQVYHKYDRPLTSDELKVVEDTLDSSTILDNLLEAMAYKPEGAEEETPMPRRRRRVRREEVAEEELPW